MVAFSSRKETKSLFVGLCYSLFEKAKNFKKFTEKKVSNPDIFLLSSKFLAIPKPKNFSILVF
jgi:hypothetical protein